MQQVPNGCPLNRREFEVIQLLAKGVTQKQLARRLGIQQSTTRTHTSAALRKLNAPNACAAVALMFQRGWAQPELRDPYEGRPLVRAYLLALNRYLDDRSDEAREAMSMIADRMRTEGGT